ncbi:hypothetical protein VP01_3086g2 [Puccinia sorghi]|uniref:RING-type domain-containing protein n=1 Tax=Puccinia sorghi TaxID=27349 RepID=A0A0L6V1G5_9BASI|nr:hypothetical protein VP01_3086g2 [Puccinia sorghi]
MPKPSDRQCQLPICAVTRRSHGLQERGPSALLHNQGWCNKGNLKLVSTLHFVALKTIRVIPDDAQLPFTIPKIRFCTYCIMKRGSMHIHSLARLTRWVRRVLEGIFLRLMIVVHGSLLDVRLVFRFCCRFCFSQSVALTILLCRPAFFAKIPEEELLLAPEKKGLTEEPFTRREHLGITDKRKLITSNRHNLISLACPRTTELNPSRQRGIEKYSGPRNRAHDLLNKCGICHSGYTINDRRVRPVNCRHYYHENCIMGFLSNGYPVISKNKRCPTCQKIVSGLLIQAGGPRLSLEILQSIQKPAL